MINWIKAYRDVKNIEKYIENLHKHVHPIVEKYGFKYEGRFGEEFTNNEEIINSYNAYFEMRIYNTEGAWNCSLNTLLKVKQVLLSYQDLIMVSYTNKLLGVQHIVHVMISRRTAIQYDPEYYMIELEAESCCRKLVKYMTEKGINNEN